MTDGPLARALDELELLAPTAVGDEVPAALARIEGIRARLWARLREPAPLELIDVSEAARLLRLSRRRIFEVSRGAGWAVRAGRRLLIDRRALLADAARGRLAGHVKASVLQDATGQHETTREPGEPTESHARRVDSCSPVAAKEPGRGCGAAHTGSRRER